jgi:SSS family solute:Na+ symporter
VDLYQKWKPDASQHSLVRTGRIATVVMVIIAFAWIPVIKNAQGLYGYLQAVQSYLAPPIFVVFFLGVFFKRMNAMGALWAMIVGFVIGMFRMIVDTPVTLGLGGLQNGYPHGSFLWIVNNMYFQYFSVLLTFISAVVMIVVSYATSAPDYSKITNLTFATTTASENAVTRASWSWKEVAGTALVLCCILGAYFYFRG